MCSKSCSIRRFIGMKAAGSTSRESLRSGEPSTTLNEPHPRGLGVTRVSLNQVGETVLDWKYEPRDQPMKDVAYLFVFRVATRASLD